MADFPSLRYSLWISRLVSVVDVMWILTINQKPSVKGMTLNYPIAFAGKGKQTKGLNEPFCGISLQE